MERFTIPAGLADELCGALGTTLPTDVRGIGDLYRTWCAQVPFDPVAKAAALVEGRNPPGDDPVEVAERWLSTGLGSTCWGHVTVLGALLERAGVRATAGLDRMLTDDLVDFHSFLVVRSDGAPLLLDPIHPSGDPLPLEAGARGNHPAYSVGLDDVEGRLEHWFDQPIPGSRSGRYVVLATDLDRADVRAFCRVSADHSGVGRRFFQRRVLTDRFVVLRPTEDGAALAVRTWRDGHESTRVIADLDEALVAAGYRPGAQAWLGRAGLLTPGSPAPWTV